MKHLDNAKNSVVKVGEGRGFVVRGRDECDRLIITAAHCLPSFPPCASFSHLEERTYPSLVGQIGQEPSVWAECFFVDPIADIAVLGPPDNQSLFDEFDAYEELVQEIQPLEISDAPEKGEGLLLSIDGRWISCKVSRVLGGPLWLADAENIAGGMSGSPVLAMDGSAIGVVVAGSCSSAKDEDDEICHEGGPMPVLTRDLPGWLLRYWKIYDPGKFHATAAKGSEE